MNPGPGGDVAGPRELAVGGDLAGARLDRALGALMRGGLRGRRRRIAEGGVILNGAICRDAARRVKTGDMLALGATDAAAPSGEARLLGREGDFCFLFKGAGLHCAALAGKDGDSLEARLPGLCAPVLRPGEKPELLQRLDWGTSGVVCAALNADAARAFRGAEAAGNCEKRYLALLTGALDAPVTARQRLDTANRRTTRALDAEAEALRHTEFLPFHVWRGEAARRLCALSGMAGASGALTLAGCRIRLGARHQIRAHAAALGHPLLGDMQYGAPGEPPGAPRFFLHHGLLAWPGGRCRAAPPWPGLDENLPPEARPRVRAWLGSAD